MRSASLQARGATGHSATEQPEGDLWLVLGFELRPSAVEAFRERLPALFDALAHIVPGGVARAMQLAHAPHQIVALLAETIHLRVVMRLDVRLPQFSVGAELRKTG